MTIKTKFTTPCFVRVEDAEEREELFAFLDRIGYEVDSWYRGNYIRIIRCWTNPKGISRAVGYPIKQVRNTDIDCGTDIELFKALAAMMDGPEITEQYMYATADLLTAKSLWEAVLKTPKCVAKKGQLIKAERLSGLYFESIRKATAQEIVEHFRNKKI